MDADEVSELVGLVRAASGCVGPCGGVRRARLGREGAGTLVSSAAAAILQHWPVRREQHVVQLVVDTASAHLRQHLDGGWLFLNLALRVTLSLLGLGAAVGNDRAPLARSAALHGVALASAWADEALRDASLPCRLELEWSNLPLVLALLRSALCKPTAFAGLGARQLSLLVLDAFLKSLPDDAADAGEAGVNIRYAWFCGPEVSWSSTFGGVVLDTPSSLVVPIREGSEEQRRREGKELPRRLALFDISLEQWPTGMTAPSSATGGQTILLGAEAFRLETSLVDTGSVGALRSWEIAQFQKLADALLDAGVSVVACQKLVDPWLADYLGHHGVSVLPRLSIRHIDHMRRLSGAVPVSSLLALPIAWSDVIGHVGEIEMRSICERTYMFVHAPDRARVPRSTVPVCTLVIGAPDEHALLELRRCVPQAVHCLKDVARSGVVFKGGGLLEVCIADVLVRRAHQAMRDSTQPLGACAAVLSIAECLYDVGACLPACSKRGVSAALVQRSEFVEAARKAISDEDTERNTRVPPGCVVEAEGPKRHAILGAFDLAGILLRLGGTIDAVNCPLG